MLGCNLCSVRSDPFLVRPDCQMSPRSACRVVVGLELRYLQGLSESTEQAALVYLQNAQVVPPSYASGTHSTGSASSTAWHAGPGLTSLRELADRRRKRSLPQMAVGLRGVVRRYAGMPEPKSVRGNRPLLPNVGLRGVCCVVGSRASRGVL